MFVALPVLLALSWVPVSNAVSASAPKQQQEKQAVGTITCPLTGEEIPACCCPVEK